MRGNTRQAVRYPIKLSICLKRQQDPLPLSSAISYDMSFTGLSVLSSQILCVHERISLWTLDAAGKDVIKLRGDIIWSSIEDIYEDNRYWVKAGIAFRPMDKTTFDGIRQLMPVEAQKDAMNKQIKQLWAAAP